MSAEIPNNLLSIGLMSGTSIDGIDAVLVRTNGEQLESLQQCCVPYTDKTRESILHAYENPQQFLNDKSRTNQLSVNIAKDHAVAVKELLAQRPRSDVEAVQLIGFHGQTVLHKPEERSTVQLGCAHTLAELTHIDTVFDFRRADIEAGGQGAPLAPIYHQILMRQAGFELPAAMLNIGGVANLTYWNGDQLIGFDTGPGNGLLDQYVQEKLLQRFDVNGEIAATGTVCQSVVDDFLRHQYFLGVKPKSLDRASFNSVLSSERLQRLNTADALATLVTLTVVSVKRAIEQFDTPPKTLIVCGGGQHNQFLVQTLAMALSNVFKTCVNTADSIQLYGDFIEAELMALLAARFHYGLPSTFSSTTGVTAPCVAGQLQRAGV